jgi:hypothetical protein
MCSENDKHVDSEPEASNQKTSNESTKTPPHVLQPTLSPQSPHTPPTGTAPDEKSSKRREDVKLGLEILGVVILIIYTVFSALQWAQIRWTNRLTARALDGSDKALSDTLGKMQGQIEATNKLYGEAQRQVAQVKRSADYAKQGLTDNEAAIHLEESPWVNIAKVYPEDRPDGGEALSVQFTNTGKSPAFGVHSLLKAESVPAGSPPVTFIFDEMDAKGAITMTPNAPEPYSIHLKKIVPPNTVIAFKSGQIHVYLGLEIWYQDYWGLKHADRFCQYFQPESQQWVTRKPDHCED